MKVFITGGTGFLGRTLTNKLLAEGHSVTIFSRSRKLRLQYAPELTYVVGDPMLPGKWQEELAKHDVVINLAGSSIFGRWDEETKEMLRNSRIETTRNIVTALEARKGKPTTFISGSAVGYYGFREDDQEINEDGDNGNDFLAELTRDWEAAANEATKLGVRVITCRIGVIIGPGGGAIKKMLTFFRFGLGAPLGTGNQWFSWVHIYDLVKSFLFLMESPDAAGPYNCTAPEPVTNREMSKTLAKVLRRPLLFAIPAFLIKQALGEFSSVLLKGQRVVPKKLTEAGFTFDYPNIESAFRQVASVKKINKQP